MSFYKLQPQQYVLARPLFTGFMGMHLSAAATLDVTTPGHLFVDDPDNPAAAFMIAAEGSYLVGTPHHAAFNQALGQRLPDLFHGGAIALMCQTDEWPVAALFDDHPFETIARRYYVCHRVTHDWKAHLPESCTVRRIDRALIAEFGDALPRHILGWMQGWGSIDQFLQFGFGFVTVDANSVVVSWSLCDAVSDERCEIGIHTREDARRLGYGAITAAAAAEYALHNGCVQVGWHCDEDNHGSIGVADRVGFNHEANFSLFFATYP